MPIVIDFPSSVAQWTYDYLKTAVIEWANRGDQKFKDRVVDFIRMGESRIFRTLRVGEMIVVGSASPNAGDRRTLLPDNWLEFDSVREDDKNVAFNPSRSMVLDRDTSRGYYGIEGQYFLMDHTPSGSEVFDWVYYAKPDPLEDSGSNWLLQKQPAIYLYAALIEAALWAKAPDDAARWGALLDKEIQEANSKWRASKISGSSLRIRR